MRPFRLFGIVFAACLAAMLVLGGAALWLMEDDLLGGRTYAETWEPAADCNVVGIAVRGDISISGYVDEYSEELAYTASDEVIEYLKTASENDSIKAILLDINSGGGEPVASEEIAEAIQGTGKPSVAWVRQVAASGAYWIASAADAIVASPNSDIGSIGVSMSYLDYASQTEEEGGHFNSLSSAKFKDTGNPYQPLSEEEIALIERDLSITHDNFVGAIAANRGLAYETVAALADGWTMLGAMALENGLIDLLGGQEEAYDVLEEQIGEEPVICWAGF